MSRLTIDISDRQHQSLKALAALEGKSIRQFALERLFPRTSGEDEAWGDLKTLIERRIASGLAGELSSKSIDQIFTEEWDRERQA